MPILTEGSDYTYLPQLLDHAGGYFSAMVYVRDYLPPYEHTYKEMVQLGDNTEAITVVGDPWTAADSATLEVWGAGAYVEVCEAAGAVETNGLLTLRVPDDENPETGNSYLVTMVIPPMSRLYPRRGGNPQLFTVGVENIRVLGNSTF